MIKKYLKHLEFIKNPYVFYKISKGLLKARLLKRDVLRSVELAITCKCNAKCSMCYSRDLYDKEKEELTVEEIKKMWEEAQKLGAFMVNLTGGEPLLRKDINEIIEVLNPRKNLIYLVTNASLLTEEKILSLKKSGLSAFQISLDSIYPEVHNKLRGVPNLYEKVINAVKLCRKHKVGVCLSSVYWHNGIDNFLKIAKLAEDLNVFVLLNYAGMVGGWSGEKDVKLSKEELELSFKLIKHYPSVRSHIMFSFAGNMMCPAGFEKIYITAYGDVMPCNKVQKKEGNIRQESLKSIWLRFLENKRITKKTSYCKMTSGMI